MAKKKQQSKPALKTAIAGIGDKFKKSDIKALSQAGAKDKKILKIASSTGNVGDKAQSELSTLTSPKKQERQASIGEAVSNIGNKFKKSDLNNLREAGLKDKVKGNNKILKIAASSKRVGDQASGKLSALNPGIKLPKLRTPTLMSRLPNTGMLATKVLNNQQYKDVGKQIKKAGKQYLQWGGTDAKARPQALGGFKIPKNFRKGSDLGALKIGKMAYKRGSFNQKDGSGSYLGRGGVDILKKNGKPANKATAWTPRNKLGKNYSPLDVLGGKTSGGKTSGGKTSGGKTSAAGGGSGSGGLSMPSYDGGDSSQNTAAGSGIYGGEGTGLNPGAPNFRRRRSRASSNRSNTQGPSQFGTALLGRPSGLNIAR
jgi:hypothetical protein